MKDYSWSCAYCSNISKNIILLIFLSTVDAVDSPLNVNSVRQGIPNGWLDVNSQPQVKNSSFGICEIPEACTYTGALLEQMKEETAR